MDKLFGYSDQSPSRGHQRCPIQCSCEAAARATCVCQASKTCVSEAFCPNFQPRAHARLTGLTKLKGASSRTSLLNRVAVARPVNYLNIALLWPQRLGSTRLPRVASPLFVAVIPDPRAARSLRFSPVRTVDGYHPSTPLSDLVHLTSALVQVLTHAARAAAKQLNGGRVRLPDVAWPAARSAALWAFCRRQNAQRGVSRTAAAREGL